jgi:hypothetical protein
MVIHFLHFCSPLFASFCCAALEDREAELAFDFNFSDFIVAPRLSALLRLVIRPRINRALASGGNANGAWNTEQRRAQAMPRKPFAFQPPTPRFAKSRMTDRAELAIHAEEIIVL